MLRRKITQKIEQYLRSNSQNYIFGKCPIDNKYIFGKCI